MEGVWIEYSGGKGWRNRTDVTRVRIAPSVTAIGKRGFYCCHNLEEVDFSNAKVTSIGKGAFYKCTSLRRITIPSSVTLIDAHAFCGCRSLKKVTFCEGLRTIAHGAFFDCFSIENVIIPSSVSYIGTNAFTTWSSRGVHEVKLGQGIQEFRQDNSVFSQSTDIILPRIAFVIYKEATTDRRRTNLFHCVLVKKTKYSSCDRTGTCPLMIISTKSVQYMSWSRLKRIERRINEIVNSIEWVVKDEFDLVRGLITYHELTEVTTLLELAIWKAHLATIGKENLYDIEARQHCRLNCGSDMNVIIRGMLQCFCYNK